MGAIKLLDKSVYELIAAGEVIERPSSVVKEMVENSIDAGATNIVVEIKNGGRTYIRITDNGCGMSKEDISLAFVRHATSKIYEQDDLNAISTLGFRGEALASVCAVSKVDVISKQKNDELGWHYVVEGGNECLLESCGCPDGTTFVIRDLFYNVPARLKFLKKDVSEGNAIATMIQKLALSHPEISFKFIRDNKREMNTPGDGNLYSVIYSIFGSDFAKTIIPVNYTMDGVHIEGYITRPINAKANRAFQNFFINSRYVKSVTCMVALEEAFRNQIMTGKFPGCVLLISINPANIDVNVHPAKIEVRFSNERIVYDAMYFAIMNSLVNHDVSGRITKEPPPERKYTPREIFKKPEPVTEGSQYVFRSTQSDIDKDIQKSNSGVKAESVVLQEMNNRSAERPIARTPVLKTENQFKDKGIGVYFGRPDSQEVKPETAVVTSDDKYVYITPSSLKRADPVPLPTFEEEIPNKKHIKVIGELFKTYIVCEYGDDMYLIDKHAAHERYNFEKLKNGSKSLDMQSLMIPVSVTLTHEEYDALLDNKDICIQLGFGINFATAPRVMLEGIPVLTDEEDPADLLTRLADILAAGKNNKGDELFDELYHSIACKASIKANSFTSKQELERLVEMIEDGDLRYCPHGRPITVKLTKREIEKMFKRIV